ncbi:ATP-binding cassette domain-containing protein [Paenibacillus lignilyticus]|uniref:ATP-binding cassette domain-containing protein n=1 Tax=Paenibacillus lignilyticus TaxID=1172615 RepID=A0ABS5C6S1_9BACL|nr:ATP-binding cassette domain-containing protein [Paenibacillus lignilyticus]MBP3961689.1 ATP-binding cassette domain-containing protein [Paenibacillus lignilyticus]MBP3963640.1 ATP-binding cassette domain-containing protein [Paenibacillus lignilyticus]
MPTTTNNLAIEVKGLKKAYKNVEVLRGVDFAVQKGSTFALLGSNGAGKTTIIKTLATLLQPDSGNAKINGYDVSVQPEQVRNEISLTGQSVTVDYILSGRENLRMMAKLRHLPNPDNQADELLRRFDLLDAADRRIATYSGGMCRRLDLAMSLLGNPRVIFLDEPTTGLDPQSRIAMWEIIKDLAKSGVTVFLTTQYLEEADHLADQIAILHEGTIVANGSPAELKNLLPRGHLELRFDHEAALSKARDLFIEYNATADENNLTLSVITDGTTKQMLKLLTKAADAEIEIAEFAQKLPTLEDVFLTFVSNEKERSL